MLLWLLLLLLSHINTGQNSRARGYSKVVEPSEDHTEMKFTRVIQRFPTQSTRDEEGAQMKRPNVHPELTWARVPTQLQHRIAVFPRLTNSQLLSTAVAV